MKNTQKMKTLLLLVIFFIQIVNSTKSPLCLACHEVVGLISKETPGRPFISIGSLIGIKYCTMKHLQKQNVCKGAVNSMATVVVNSLWLHYTDPHLICSKLKFCSAEYKIRNLTQQIKLILLTTPNKTWQVPTKRKSLRIMHISDLHPDLYYTYGANKKCTEPVCCRQGVEGRLGWHEMLTRFDQGQRLHVSNGQIKMGYPKDNQVATNTQHINTNTQHNIDIQHNNNDIQDDNAAGYWGSIAKCDLPFQTFQLFLKDLGKLKLDLIIWTGDNTPHDIWQQTQDYNLNYTFAIVERLKRYTNATIIPAMGNHQSWPVNVYDYQGERQAVLNGGLANAWRQWLDQKAYNMLRTKGYYSIQLPQINNVKIISMNTQASNDENWFLMRDPTDPGNMLKWIQEQLLQSQKKNQFVYMIGHIPPKSSINDWSSLFNALVQRYSYIIRGQFYGHSHADHIGFFVSSIDSQKLTSYYLLPPSLTTYSDKNSNYRIMSIDYDTLQVVDYDQYMLDLNKYKTREDQAKFQFYYRFKQVYQLDDMQLNKGIYKFYSKLRDQPQTRKLYTILMSGGLEKGQTGRNVFCDTLTSPKSVTQCNGGTFKKSSFQKAAGPWKTLIHKS